MIRVVGLLLMGVPGLVLGACDTRQNFEAPEWTLSRMLSQPRYSPYGESAFFADGKAMRSPVAGTIARDEVLGPEALIHGTTHGEDSPDFPLAVTAEFVLDGKRQFEVVCAACHGIRGDGRSVVATKMQLRAPPSLLGADIAAFAPGRLFRVITEGYGLMLPMDVVLSGHDRWAVVAYVKALEFSQAVPKSALSADLRSELDREAP